MGRLQTTIHADSASLETLGKLSEKSGVSRSKLIDLAIRRFARWAENLSPEQLKFISDYEFAEDNGVQSSRPPKTGVSGEHRITIPKDPTALRSLATELIASLERQVAGASDLSPTHKPGVKKTG